MPVPQTAAHWGACAALALRQFRSQLPQEPHLCLVTRARAAWWEELLECSQPVAVPVVVVVAEQDVVAAAAVNVATVAQGRHRVVLQAGERLPVGSAAAVAAAADEAGQAAAGEVAHDRVDMAAPVVVAVLAEHRGVALVAVQQADEPVGSVVKLREDDRPDRVVAAGPAGPSPAGLVGS